MLDAYTVYDKKARSYARPFFTDNDEVAIRMFLDAAKDEGSVFYLHPEDFVLYCIGHFDEQSGLINGFEAIVHVSDLVNLMVCYSDVG